MSFDR